MSGPEFEDSLREEYFEAEEKGHQIIIHEDATAAPSEWPSYCNPDYIMPLTIQVGLLIYFIVELT
jgi:hypothetical protein